MIGKHYRICEALTHKHHRHYTVSNCMNPDIYSEYIKALKDSSENNVAKLNVTNVTNN